MSDELLMALMEDRVKGALEAHVGEVLTADLLRVVEQPIQDAMAAYRTQVPAMAGAAAAPSSAYESDLGAYILQQNPYSSREQLDLPKIPTSPDEERPWVRKAGVLRDQTALNPLPGNEPIPSGPIFHFAYEDWAHLRETYEDKGNPQNPDNYTDFYTEREPGRVPPIPAKDSDHYPHNIVKIVRLRYTLKARRYQDGQGPAGEPANDRQAAYILVLYTGSDNG